MRTEDRKIIRKFQCDKCGEGFEKKYFLLSHIISCHENANQNCKNCENRSFSFITSNFIPKK